MVRPEQRSTVVGGALFWYVSENCFPHFCLASGGVFLGYVIDISVFTRQSQQT